MATITSASGGRRRHAHTEVYSPIETVIARIVYWIFGVIIALLAIRFVFSLFGANQDAGFVELIYAVTGVFMVPFDAVFGTARLGVAVFEWSVLVAIAIYALIAWGIVALVHAASPREHAETVETVESEERDDHVHMD